MQTLISNKTPINNSVEESALEGKIGKELKRGFIKKIKFNGDFEKKDRRGISVLKIEAKSFLMEISEQEEEVGLELKGEQR